MTAEQLDTLGRLADKADNFAHAVNLPGLPAALHVEALSGGMRDIRDALRELYQQVSGENPWQE